MSYGPPRPKSTYGDTDFFDDSAPTNNESSGQSTSMYPTQASGSIYSPPVSPTPIYGTQSPGSRPQMPNKMELTPEDLIFLKQLQRRILWNNVAPGIAVGVAAAHILAKARNLPYSTGRLVLAGFAGAFFGIFAASRRNRDFILQYDLDTPTMRLLKAQADPSYKGKISQFVAENQPTEFQYNPNRSNVIDHKPIEPPISNWTPTHEETHLRGDEPPRGNTTSYDELRARNRGYMK